MNNLNIKLFMQKMANNIELMVLFILLILIKHFYKNLFYKVMMKRVVYSLYKWTLVNNAPLVGQAHKAPLKEAWC